MANRSSTKSTRAQGGGRTPNSEPRIQVFKEFAGINFENASKSYLGSGGSDQTDLQMNYVYIQNNVAVASNKTLETRDDLVPLFYAPSGTRFTGPVCLIGKDLYAAKSDGNIGVGDLSARASSSMPLSMVSNVRLNDRRGSTSHTWTCLGYYDDNLIAMTEQDVMWTGELSTATYSQAVEISNTVHIADPLTDFNGHLNGKGTLTLSIYATDDHPFRVQIAHTYVNKFGPTKVSPNTVFYANYPVTEWNSGCYLQIDGTIPSGQGVEAIELYYATDNATNMIFLGRVDVAPSATTWKFDWYGYFDATNMWVTGNLIAPTENYTDGVPASKMCAIDGRLYFWGSNADPQRLYIGGNPGNLFSVSPGTGGGFVDVEPGTGQEVRNVCKYKTQGGNSIVTMLCDSKNSSKEQRYNLVENSISLSNEQTMKSWQAEQVAGAVGCKSYDGALVCQDGLYSVSRYGLALTTMTMEYNSQIKTTYVSDAIKPVFTEGLDTDRLLSNAVILECDGVIYMAMGKPSGSYSMSNIDNMLFCYDIDLKAWWTYTLDLDTPILAMFHVDWQGGREGIGIVTGNYIYMLPTTRSDDDSTNADHRFRVRTADLATQMPQQGWQYLSQLEFHFDHFVGNATIEVTMTDMFGRNLTVRKVVYEANEVFDYVVRMRVDQRVMSYSIDMSGAARFRMTHFLARVYTMSNKMTQVWGFDDFISHRSAGSVHPTFKSYNDVRDAIFT